MYFQLSESLKRRFIDELRRFWAAHPKYADDLVKNIQGKFSFDERAQYGIVVKTGGGSHVALSPDNYVGIVQSYVYKAMVQNYSGVAVEWVREDALAIQKNNGVFPSPPGVYYIELTGDNEFYVDPLLDVFHEPVTLIDEQNAQLQHPFLACSLQLWEMPSGFLMKEPDNYTADAATGAIQLVEPLTGNRWLVADYKMPGTSTGPHQIVEMHANNRVIPGVVIAFGHRLGKGDRLAVVVHNIRRPASLEYGGRWSMSLDFDITARDVYAQQEMSDYSVMYVWAILRPRLSTEGIEIMDISIGGESEEIYDEAGDEYYYNATFSLTVETEWGVHVPLAAFVRQSAAATHERTVELINMTDEAVANEVCEIKAQAEHMGLTQVTDPFFFFKKGHMVMR